ncbi:Protein-serine/threonine phosphatase protein [Dioscorea alata]|uniref:Protein-serine/threonine phosphatase protein n=1 Tax=Dioscorea alata TaxID=55571 RepID=A0ACB7W741_DIOAL|nr:Protein-serine/threonine phosphatase protein [Dioscorea alata]
MQTKKKVPARSVSREHANPRSCRQQKKGSTACERKVTDMITSSTKKQKNGRILSSKSSVESEKDLNSMHTLSSAKTDNICLINGNTLHPKLSDDRTSQCVLETIFSPSFHLPKDGSSGVPGKADFVNFFMGKDQAGNLVQTELECANSCDEEFSNLGKLSPEVSAIYLAMQHSKLECVDEPTQESMSTDMCVEYEDDDFDDFDPYFFIKNLPDLSAVVPTFRPMLLPRQTRSCPSTTLVLDLDETLVHSSLEPCEDADFTFPVNFSLREHTVYVRCRPHLRDFMERVASLFEIIIFTASQSIYAEQLLNVLDPKRKLFRHRVYRESCVYVEGNYLKDLSVLGRDLSRVIIIDNSPQAFGFQIDNGIPIESWFDDRSDQELILLLPFLESLVGVEDVRPLIARKFNLRQKVAAATCLGVDFK